MQDVRGLRASHAVVPCLLGSRVYADGRPRNVVAFPCCGLGLFLCHGRDNPLDEDDARLLSCRHCAFHRAYHVRRAYGGRPCLCHVV